MSNSTHIETAQEMSEQVKPEILNHPLSPQLENQRLGGDDLQVLGFYINKIGSLLL